MWTMGRIVPQKRSLTILSAILLSIGIFVYVVTISTRESAYSDCTSTSNPRSCFISQTRDIASRKGIPDALEYVKNEVARNGDYSSVHLSMHVIGWQAYLSSSDIGRALQFLPNPSEILADFFLYNGFQHGAFEAFFQDYGTTLSTMALAERACGSFVSSGEDFEMTTSEGIFAAECIHAVGHAIMGNYGNAVLPSLAECDTLPRPWMAGWCAHGVFMENHYLHSAKYQEGAPRPDVTPDAMESLCANVSASYQMWCHQFIGWSYMELHPDDFAGAFTLCASLPTDDARICVARVSRLYLVSTYRNNVADILTTCGLARDYETECLYGAAIGINEGTGGKNIQVAQLCDSIHADLRAGCYEVVHRSHESLARMYVTEL